MSIRYDKLFALLKEKGYSTYRIRQENIVSQAALTKMKNGTGDIDTRTIERLCAVLNCQPGDIMEYVSDGEGVA
ncbi:MAG: helix-turn-helix transcriptional regulator [Firmicutes bacterium]|nr:helix-turn-helix transcriptional regulator [Bacillota bacterium]